MASHCGMHLPGTQGSGQAVPEPPSLPPPQHGHCATAGCGSHPGKTRYRGCKAEPGGQTAAQLRCICTRLGRQPAKVSENFCSHPNPPRLLWWKDSLFIKSPACFSFVFFCCPKKFAALSWLHEMTKSLLKVCCRLSELKPKAPGVYLLVEHPLGCRWKTARSAVSQPLRSTKSYTHPQSAPRARVWPVTLPGWLVATGGVPKIWSQ